MKKKIIAALLCAALAVTCLAACGTSSSSAQESQTAPAEETAGLANPMTEVADLEALNSQLGAQLYCPNDVAEDQSCYIINVDGSAPIGQYSYSLDGRNYTVRYCADFNAAISGVYVNGAEIYADPNASDWHDFTVTKTDDGFCAHWCNVNGQYTFLVTDATDMEQSAFEQIARAYADGTTPAETDADAGTEAQTAAFAAFLQNQSNVTVDAEMEELAQGSVFTLTGLEDAFVAGLTDTMWLENASCTGVQAACIDCGNDGIPELALRLTVDTEQNGELLEDFIIRESEDGLHLVAGFTTYYRTYSTLYTNGLAVTGGSNSAFSSGETWYYVSGDGQKLFLYSAEMYPCLDQAVIPQEAVPTSIWDQYPATEISGSGSITLTVYNFTEDQSDYDAYMKNSLYVFTDESGNDAAVDAEHAQLNADFGLQVLSAADVSSQIAQVYAAAGVPSGVGENLQPVEWQDISALIG